MKESDTRSPGGAAAPRYQIYPYAVGIFASLLLVSNIAATQPVEFRLWGDFGLILDGGFCGTTPTTVIDLTSLPPTLVRAGRGPVNLFGLE